MLHDETLRVAVGLLQRRPLRRPASRLVVGRRPRVSICRPSELPLEREEVLASGGQHRSAVLPHVAPGRSQDGRGDHVEAGAETAARERRLGNHRTAGVDVGEYVPGACKRRDGTIRTITFPYQQTKQL